MSNRTLNMTDQLYQYLLDHSLRETEIQYRLREQTSTMTMSNMQIAPEQGQFMAFLVKLLGVRNALEVGVFTGYSSLSVALAMPDDGHILACDLSEKWTDIARQYWREAGVEHKIDLRLAPATETLQQLIESGKTCQYDFAFIDADKENYDHYFEYCLQLLRPGGLMLIDNTLWGGDVANLNINDKNTQAIRALNKKLYGDRRVDISHLPVADGITLLRKL